MTMNNFLNICEGFPEVTLGPDELLLMEGQKTGLMYVLIEGEVEVLKGDVQLNRLSEPGVILGDMSIILDIPHMATVRTLKKSKFYKIENAKEFVSANKESLIIITKLMAERLLFVTSYLMDLKKQYESEGSDSKVDYHKFESLLNELDFL